jgi:pimeloyl-ACP methyl ester carboxylesterase
MLPGAGMAAEEFAANGMVAAVQARHADIDIIAARVPMELYLDGNAAAALHRAVIEPAMAQFYSELWVLGISLGGMGALLYAAQHPELVAGLVLLAPFLGTPGTIASIEAAGGLAHWTPGEATTAPEARMLEWLRDGAGGKLYLGYGESDRFARGHRMLGALLPPEHVVTLPGGHDWGTWAELWARIASKRSLFEKSSAKTFLLPGGR